MADQKDTKFFDCKVCKKILPTSDFYKLGKRFEHRPRPVNSSCKSCHREHYGKRSEQKAKAVYKKARGLLFRKHTENLICPIYITCLDCKTEQLYTNFAIDNERGKRKSVCLECRKIRHRKSYERHREKNIARQRERMARLAADGKAKDIKRRYRKAQRARYLAAGLTANGTPRKMPVVRKSMVERRRQISVNKWRRDWLKHSAPAPCVAAWYAGTGKPWNNPRLDSGEKFRIRYNNNHEFRAKEIIRAQNRKVARAERIAELSDGSVTPEALGHLFGEAKFCVYCVEPFRDSYEKTADHVDPLYLGGKHSMDNLVIACRSCNSKKGRKGFVEWLIAAKQTSN